ncbi:hypothetical protein [uncultured Veillonella sp.]|uniref:hypothetical protein n=1 Tax=uncultured Veillonella sp. TaxID=159268 RepID=UPI002592BD4F|nr:hypothetical protein [uncultured Veillonella sp.]
MRIEWKFINNSVYRHFRNIFLGFFFLTTVVGYTYNVFCTESINQQYVRLTQELYTMQIFRNRIMSIENGRGNLLIAKEIWVKVNMGDRDTHAQLEQIRMYFIHNGWNVVRNTNKEITFDNRQYVLSVRAPEGKENVQWIVELGFNTFFQRFRL